MTGALIAASWMVAALPVAWAQVAAAQDPQLEQVQRQLHMFPLESAVELNRLAAQWPSGHPLRLQALALLGMVEGRLNHAETLATVLDELDHWPGQVPMAAAAALLSRAGQALEAGPVQRAERLARQARLLSPDPWPAWLMWRLLMIEATALDYQGHFKQSLPLYQEARRLADTMGGTFSLQTRTYHAQSLMQAEQRPAARALLEEVLRDAAKAGHDYAQASALTAYAYLDVMENHQDSRRAHVQQALVHARRAGSKQQIIGCLVNLTDLLAEQDRLDEALQISQEAMAMPEPYYRELRTLAHGQILVRLHRKDEGMRHVQAALAMTRTKGRITLLADYLIGTSEILESAGYLADAVALQQSWRHLAFDVAQAKQQGAVLELQEAYAAETRQRNLDLLQRENAMNQTLLERQHLRNLAWRVGLAALAAFVVAGLWLLRRLQRRNLALAQTSAQLKFLSEHDALTGLLSRRGLDNWLQQGTAPGLGTSRALLIIDLDHFKLINDRLGHAAGDGVLQAVATRLRDVAPAGSLIMRWGGEEFLLLAPAADAPAAAWLASQVLHAIGAQPIVPSSGQAPVRVTASIGWSWVQPAQLQPGPLLQDVLPQVDQALYIAKSHGRNRAVPAMV